MSKSDQKVPCPPFYGRIGEEKPPHPNHPDNVLDELEERFWALDQLAYASLLAAENPGDVNDAVGEHVMTADVAHAIWHHARDLRDAHTAIVHWIKDRQSRGGAQ